MAEQGGARKGFGAEALADVVENGVHGIRAGVVERQWHLQRAVFDQVRDRDPEQRDPAALDRRPLRREQVAHRCEHGLAAGGGAGERLRAGRAGEVVEAQSQHHGPPDAASAPHPPGHPVDQADQDRVELRGRAAGAAERRLRADRLAAAALAHRAGVVVVREPVDVTTGGAAENPHQPRLAELGEVADDGQPVLVKALCGRRADSPKRLDGQRVEELAFALGRDEQQAVRLRRVARHLRQRLRPRDADRDRQPDLLADVAPQTRRDLARRPLDPLEPADVEERLVDRQRLHLRARLLEDLEHRLACRDVRREARLDRDQVRAELARFPPAHGGANAERARLVGGGQDDAATDDHRPPAQALVVALVDGGEERVEVRVEDRRLWEGHERMFVHGWCGVKALTLGWPRRGRRGSGSRGSARPVGHRNRAVGLSRIAGTNPPPRMGGDKKGAPISAEPSTPSATRQNANAGPAATSPTCNLSTDDCQQPPGSPPRG